MRLFIAIELPKNVRSELSSIQREVKQLCSGGRFVPEDNFHVTLHFIGESDRLADAVTAMQEAVRGIRPFALHLGGCGSFGKPSQATSIVHVLGDVDELAILYESLQSALFDMGFSRERKRFTPHITLGRSVELDELCAGELSALRGDASFSVNSIILYESRRDGGRMIYSPIHKERF